MSKARAISLFAVVCATAVPAHAQPDGGAAGSAIVVTGSRPMTEDETLEAVRRVARPVDGQLARFNERICPLVMGFDAPYEKIVANRIKATAARIGAAMGGEGCVPNLNVVIVDDGRQFVRELLRQYPGALGGVSRREYRELTEGEGAARSWSATMLTNSAGKSAGSTTTNGGGGTATSGYQGSSVSFNAANVMRVYESSTINPSVQQSIVASWVVLETDATFGKSLTQIADYAAMRGLAMVRPAELGTNTILELFEDGAESPPPALTEFDIAYLTSLYNAPARRWARSQVRHIADAVANGQADQRRP